MASPYRRARLSAGVARGNVKSRDNGPRDLTDPSYLTVPSLGPRFVRVLTGRGTYEPGYALPGTQPGALQEGLGPIPRVLKMVSPLTGQGPADPRSTGYFAHMDYSTLAPRIVRVQTSVASNIGFRVIRPRVTAVRRMDTRGAGTVTTY